MPGGEGGEQKSEESALGLKMAAINSSGNEVL